MLSQELSVTNVVDYTEEMSYVYWGPVDMSILRCLYCRGFLKESFVCSLKQGKYSLVSNRRRTFSIYSPRIPNRIEELNAKRVKVLSKVN